MSATTFTLNPNPKEINSNKGFYKKRHSGYISPRSIDMKQIYKDTSLNIMKEIALNKKTLNFIIDQINDYEKRDIESSVEEFLEPYSSIISEYSINKDVDSDYHIVEITQKKLPISELFNLADRLNEEAFENDLGIIVIAGV